jgi:hypothetical protein
VFEPGLNITFKKHLSLVFLSSCLTGYNSNYLNVPICESLRAYKQDELTE